MYTSWIPHSVAIWVPGVLARSCFNLFVIMAPKVEQAGAGAGAGEVICRYELLAYPEALHRLGYAGLTLAAAKQIIGESEIVRDHEGTVRFRILVEVITIDGRDGSQA